MQDKLIRQYESQGASLLEEAKGITIVDDTTRELATEFAANCRAAIKTITAEFKPDIEKAHQLHKDLLARKNRLCKPIEEAQAVVDAEIEREWLEREKKRREEERQARIAEEAERKRQEAELAREAQKAIDAGDMETAEALADSKVVITPVKPVEALAKTMKSVAGSVTMRKDIKVELTDKSAVIAAVGDGKLPDTLIDVNVGAAKKYAKAAGLTEMPGFRITETANVSGRGR